MNSLANCMFFSAFAVAQERTWTDQTGKYRTIAELLKYDEHSVTMRKQNGVEIVVPLNRLCAADALFVQNLRNAAAESQGKQFPSQFPLAEISPARQSEIANNDLKARLESFEYMAARKSLSDLKEAWPTAPQPDLIAQLVACSQADDGIVRRLALELLANHDPKKYFDLMIQHLDDDNFEVRWAVYDYLRQTNDVRAFDPLLKNFSGPDNSKVASVLESFGTPAEAWVIPLLKDPTKSVRISACSLAGKIGTERSLAELEKLRDTDEELSIRFQAKNAIRLIESRLEKRPTE